MKKNLNRLIVCITLFIAMAIPVFGAEKIKLATLDWEPYIGEKLKNHGFQN
jgi:hypothetical protein